TQHNHVADRSRSPTARWDKIRSTDTASLGERYSLLSKHPQFRSRHTRIPHHLGPENRRSSQSPAEATRRPSQARRIKADPHPNGRPGKTTTIDPCTWVHDAL